ncbi:hypothetical protein FRC12_008601 [Ceratobasidium sp. 428]|nr:hypothetical protein FRC12_008601 [Ceratobasidium sp. 428]
MSKVAKYISAYIGVATPNVRQALVRQQFIQWGKMQQIEQAEGGNLLQQVTRAGATGGNLICAHKLSPAVDGASRNASYIKDTPAKTNPLHVSILTNASMRLDEGNTQAIIPYALPMPPPIWNLYMSGIKTLNTLPKRPSAQRLHSLPNSSRMHALDLLHPATWSA